jgi:hypothetical protein
MMKIGRFFQIAVLLLIAAGSQPAIAAFWEWSKTAATNSGADPTINWAEGMSPSSVNDSARAMMARAAEYRDDISGALTLGGTSTVYTLTTNQTLCTAPASTTTPVTGQMIAFTPNVTNGVAATLTTDACSAFPLQSTAGTALPAGSILAGTPYRSKFSGTAWVMEAGYGNPYNVPLGSMLPSTLTVAPNSNFVIPAGQCLSTTTYSAYWAALGSPASGTCAGGQFRIVDLAGRVPAGLDTMPGFPAANRLTAGGGCGTAMTSVGAVCANATQQIAVGTTNLPSLIPAGTVTLGGNYPFGGSSINVNTTSASATVWDRTPAAYSSFGGGVLTASFSGTQMGGTSVPLPTIMPVIGLTYFLRVI